MPRHGAVPAALAVVLLAGGALGSLCHAQPPGPVEPELAAVEAPRPWAIAVGAMVTAGPEFAGASRIGLNLQPGFALRWGRVSIASRSAFAVRGEGAAAQGGLRVELLRSERWRSSLGLRWDSGRDEDSSPELRGLGDVRGTLRARLSLGYRLDDGWRAGASWSNDLLGRGGGWQGDVSLGRDHRLTPATTVGASLALGYGGRRWMQNNFGITPGQSLRSGYAVYEPGAGLRDLGLTLGGRTEFGGGWALFYGGSVSRLLDSAAASPLVRERNGWGLTLGVVKRL